MLVLTWNLFHGRALPPQSRSLYPEFAAKLHEWRWDLALLQEVPPWWPAALARELGVEQRCALTSRNSLPALRRAVAERRPELIKSNGGGCNAILSRLPIREHRVLTLRRRPERRVAQLVRLSDRTHVVNLHAGTSPARAEDELARLSWHALSWSRGEPLILGGDLNLTAPQAPLQHLAGHHVDHLLAEGFLPAGEASLPDRTIAHRGRFELSDHAALLLELRAGSVGLSR
ncbi:MAG TPA: endonuclease/exonuclease/phosphatase family protein [Solirubrobacteraceae bacterium]|nr:endonuclease/exonuclease/phosphatase family protein [Solirubrobacteraceae bacterium]